MFRDYRAKSLEDVYLEDIPHILHPNFAQQYLAYSALPNRIMTSWDLPEGYELFVSKYRQFHYQFAYMAYQDALADVKSGKVVLLRKQETGYTTTGVLTFTGDLEYDLPLLVRSRLSYLISHQLKRPVYYVRRSAPIQHAQSAKTINSKAAGRLLAAGGIYNDNIEGFRKTAEDLGGEAPDGYNQVMDNKGLLIAGASVAAGLTMGRMQVPELEALESFGAKGTYTSRPFDLENAGGPIEYLTTEGVNITYEGISIVEKHISRFDPDPGNDFMIGRLKKIAGGEILPEQVGLNYYTHECREYQRYCNLGWETGRPADDLEAYNLWNNTHTATLEDYRITGNDLYHPDAPLW